MLDGTKILELQFKIANLESENYRLLELTKAQRRLLLQWQERYLDAKELVEETKFINK